MFVELVLLDAPLDAAGSAPNESLSQLARLPDVRLIATPHLTAKFDVGTTMIVEQHFGVLDRATFTSITLVPRHRDGGEPVLDVEVGFSLPNADATKTPAVASASLPIVAHYGRPSLASVAHPGDPKRALIAVANAYRIRNSEDLRTLFQCKMRQHQAAAATRP